MNIPNPSNLQAVQQITHRVRGMAAVLTRRMVFIPVAALLSLGLASTAFGQMQWSSYDTSGNLVTANVATGGDLNSGGSVTFTIPANTQLSFVTKSFTPFSVAAANARKLVTFNVSASAGFGGVTQRTMGWGLYNSASTDGFTDDVGYFGLWNGGGPYIETYDHPSGAANLFSGTKLGQGTVNTGTPSDGVTYTNQIQLVMNSAATGISLGTSSSTLANAGLAMNGVNVVHRVYTNPVNGPLGGATTFDEFVFMFNNTTAGPVTVTLSAVALGNSLTWDASGANPTAPTDGAGNWSSTNANWSSGSSDSPWSPGYSAVFGANNGAAGAVTVTDAAGVTVSNITINAAGSGSYSIGGSNLTLIGSPTINVTGSATIGNVIAGTGFTKDGPGSLLLNETANNLYTGDTIINNGTLQPGGTGGRLYVPGNLIINTNGTFIAVSGNPGSGVFGNGVLVLNGQNPGGSNVFVNSGAWISAGTCVLANGAVITNASGATSGAYAVTNSDARSGSVWLTRHGFGIFNNIYKSTAGTVIISTRPNASATDGYIATLNAGALVFDYAYAANAAVKLKANAPLTFAGGMLVFSNASPSLNPSSNNPGTGGTFFNAGASSLYSTNAGSSGGNLTMGAITRNTGATFNLVKPAGPGNIGSSTANVNGIVGGWNTYNLTDWTTGTTTWTALAAGSYTTSADPTTWAAANNVSLSASTSANVTDGTSINTLRLTAAATVTLDGALTLSAGGLLVTGSGATTITGGTLRGGSGTDLIVHQYASANLTIDSTLADNGTATSLTKDGTGKLIITGTDTMTGTNFLNGGVVEVSDLAKLASGPLDMNGGTLRYTGSDAASTRVVTTRGLGPIFDIAGGTTVTQSGVIKGSGDVFGDFGGLTKTGNGTLILTASNYFNGETVVNNGALVINGTNSFNPAVWDAGKLTIYGGTLAGSGWIAGPVTIKNGGTLAPGNGIGTLTLATNLTLESGSTNLFEVQNSASGDLLQVQGNLVIGANSTIAISILGAALEPATNTLITYTGTKSGSFNPKVIVIGGSLNSSLTVDESTPGQIKLVAAPQVAITGQPADLIVSTNDPATFNVAATGTAPLFYQWYRYTDLNGGSPTAQTDATNASFTIANAQGTDSGYYGVVVSNSYNAVTSRIATLIVGNVVPVLSGPTNKTVIAGNNVTFNTTVVLANPAPALQWQTNGVDVAGATGSSLTLTSVPFAYDGMIVSVIATNLAGATTNFATLAVTVAPVITPQPTNLTVNAGDTAAFVSGATGVPAPTFQWYKNNLLLSGETGSTLTIASAQGANIASYKLVASNAAGSVTSSVVTLTVNSTTLATTTLAPANGATGIGYDTPLYVTFNGPVSTVNSGKIRIFNVTNSATPVDTIDMSSNTVVISSGINLTNNIQPHSLFSGDAQVINYFPVIITGNTAAIYPHSGVMTSNQTYYVTMDNGIVRDGSGAYFAGISDTNAWQFTTKLTGPTNPTNLVVAADGSGDFVTVQGAVDSIVPGNTNYTVININNGNYVEIVNISGKNNVTFRGQSRTGTVVGYPNNNNLTGTTGGRMAFKVNASDIKLENLTLTNGTPQGGSQAETLLIYNSGLRCVVNSCDIVSRQDTILINATASQGYFYNCKVVGNFDYIWGSGVGYFDSCVFHTLTNSLSGSYNLTAARTGTAGTLSATTPWVNPNGTLYSAYGFSFVNCRFEADAGVTGITLAGSNGTVGGLDSWVNCWFDTSAYVTPTTTLSNTYVFWQNNNKDITGVNPVSFANVQTIGVTNNDPRLLAATNIVTWFSGWLPQLAPNTAPVFITPPAGTNIAINVGVNLSVACAATDSDAPSQTVTYSLLPGFPTGAAVNPGSGMFTWRPAAAQANSSNPISVVATDNGTPNLSATNTFTVTVNPLTQPMLGTSTYAGGQFSMSVSGQVGPDYTVQVSTNLTSGNWTSLLTTNPPAMPFIFTDTNGALPMQFYRILVGP